MADSREAAYALPEGAVASSEPQHLGVVPGLFVPGGAAVAISDLGGISAEDMDALVAEHDLPLEKSKALSEERQRLEGMKFDDLKAEAERRGIGVDGHKKADFVDALDAAGPEPVASPQTVTAPGAAPAEEPQ